jgi:predicted MPP superfamily phosphohydrolase
MAARPAKRRIAAAAVGAGGALAAYALWWEPRRLVLRRPSLRLPRWPPELDELRVGLISDLHAGGPHVDADRVGRVVRDMNRHAPHVVALLGDFVDPGVVLGEPIAPEVVASRLGALQAPLGVFAVLGNHDWVHGGERVSAALREAGITVLEDEAVRLAVFGRELWIAGVGDLHERDPDLEAALAAVPEDAPVLLLAHDPDLFPQVPERVALTLSGHTHGGQVDLRLLRRSTIPSRFGDRYAGGHIEERGRHLYVSRGIGTAHLPVRFRVPPEIAVLALTGAR